MGKGSVPFQSRTQIKRELLRVALTMLMAHVGCTVDNPAYRPLVNVEQPDGLPGAGGEGGGGEGDGGQGGDSDLVVRDSSVQPPVMMDASRPVVVDASPSVPDVAVASPKASSFFDTFDGNGLSTSWQSSVTGAGCTVSQSGGYLRFVMTGPPGLCRVRSVKTYDIREDAVFFRIDPIVSFYPPIRFFIFIEADGQTLEYGFINDLMEAQLLVLPSRMRAWKMPGTYRPRPTYWRIAAHADHLHFEHSTDAKTWTETATRDLPFSMANVRVGVGVEVSSTIPGPINIGVASFNR